VTHLDNLSNCRRTSRIDWRQTTEGNQPNERDVARAAKVNYGPRPGGAPQHGPPLGDPANQTQLRAKRVAAPPWQFTGLHVRCRVGSNVAGGGPGLRTPQTTTWSKLSIHGFNWRTIGLQV